MHKFNIKVAQLQALMKRENFKRTMKHHNRNISFGCLLFVLILMSCDEATPARKNVSITPVETTLEVSNEHKLDSTWMVIDMEGKGFIEKMVYADTVNFMHEKVYPCATCMLRAQVGKALYRANVIALARGYRLVIFDCYRPLPLQQKMFDLVPDRRYVADPSKGSKHNKGAAVDIGLANQQGQLLDMGTAFDDFTEKAHVHSTQVSRQAQIYRQQLQDIMQTAGFTGYENEWWHFNYEGFSFENSADSLFCP